jgi:tetratricopeptide (TPR) repeat protein
MAANPHSSKALALEPVEFPTGGADAPRAPIEEIPAKEKPQRELRMTSADEFLATAAKEYEAGTIDRALWRRAAEQCRGDASLVIAAYLNARATALRHKREESAKNQPHPVSPKPGPSDAQVEVEADIETASANLAGVLARAGRIKLLYAAGATAALVIAATIVFLVASPDESDSSLARTPPAQRSSPSTAPASAKATATDSKGSGSAASAPSLAATVQQLKAAGNWNVVVLYATEWTRKEPGNAIAWHELSVGYAKLRQYNDALDAAAKAVQLSPGDSLVWRNLGQINLAVDRLPEAGFAFDRALAVSPDDADARCGAALVAQRQSRSKDPGAISARVGPSDASCPDLASSESASVVVGSSAARKPVPPPGR